MSTTEDQVRAIVEGLSLDARTPIAVYRRRENEAVAALMRLVEPPEGAKITRARQAFRDAFAEDSGPGGFYDAYVSNVAMLLHDQVRNHGLRDSQSSRTRNPVANLWGVLTCSTRNPPVGAGAEGETTMTDWEAIEARLRVLCEVPCVKRRCAATSLILMELVEASRAMDAQLQELKAKVAEPPAVQLDHIIVNRRPT